MNNPFGRKKRQILQLKSALSESQMNVQKLTRDAYDFGLQLRFEIFFPEYLGFEEVKTELDDGSVMTIFSMGNFNLSRGAGKNWVLVTPDGKAHQFAINNMLEAIIILNAFGYPVTVKMYLSGRILIQQMRDHFKQMAEQREQDSTTAGESVVANDADNNSVPG